MTWTLSGFADEIGSDLEEQLGVLAAESMHHLELRSVWGTNVVDLDDRQLQAFGARLSGQGVRVSAIGSPIGKVPVDSPLAPELDRMRRVGEIARRLDARIVRVFSFLVPEGAPPEQYRQAVVDRMGELARVAEEEGVVLAHENELGLYGDTPERCLDLLASVGSPALRSTFDAGNFVQCGVRPHAEGYELLRPYLVYVQIKDALASTGRETPAGEGDGELRETLQALRDSQFDGFFSVEPHLARPGPERDSEGPGEFRRAVQALKGLLTELGIAWR